MSRVSKNPIPLPNNVQVNITSDSISVKGPLGNLDQAMGGEVSVKEENGQLVIVKLTDSKQANAMSGTIRSLVSNMVTGVTVGFEKKLQLVGVGYRAQASGKNINLLLGYSHPIDHKVPDGITIETPSQTEILVKGIDKQKVGQTAAEIRAYRKPEFYKGKGVRYSDEQIILKEAKKK